jgi:HSP20 family protein
MFELVSTFANHNGRSVDPAIRAFADLAMPALGWAGVGTYPPADVVETADAIVVRLDLPGHKSEDIQLKVEKDVLSIEALRRPAEEKSESVHRAERTFGKVSRSFALPASVDTGRTEARYEDGVLEITLPKREEAKPRTIAVKTGR